MVNDSSLVGGRPPFAFDLESQKGMMILLAAIRVSELAPEQKNELRDLAFLYTNGGRDQSVRIMLEQKVLAAGLQPPAPIAPPQPVIKPAPFGTSRPAPTFSFAPASVIKDAQSQPAPSVSPTAAPSVPATGQQDQARAVVASEPVQPAEPTPRAAPIVEPAVVSTPVSIEEPLPADTQSLPVPEVMPTVVVPTPSPVAAEIKQEPSASVQIEQPTVQPVVENTVSAAPIAYDSEQATQRIREIKALVNEQVGNPVNLVDINNDVGREYMAALLDAMKKINSGTSAISAMRRLEESFKIVQKTLEAHKENEQAPAKEVVESVAPVHEVAPVISQEIEDSSVPASFPVVNENTADNVATDLPPSPHFAEVIKNVSQQSSLGPIVPPITQPEPRLEPEEIPETPSSVESIAEEAVDDSNREVVPPTPVIQTEEVPLMPSDRPNKVAAIPAGKPGPIPARKNMDEIESAWGPATDTLRASVKFGEVTSLAQSEQQLRTPNELPLASDLATSSAGDPLFTREVEDGLQQLLAEWSLFKKSGLFGTGPKGREHPLFKKMAGLQIPLLLAGRFEGATQEIKQSITDYMNGWRYEQGIIYEPGETFEHYLRRVIRHILDLQKKRHHS